MITEKTDGNFDISTSTPSSNYPPVPPHSLTLAQSRPTGEDPHTKSMRNSDPKPIHVFSKPRPCDDSTTIDDDSNKKLEGLVVSNKTSESNTRSKHPTSYNEQENTNRVSSETSILAESDDEQVKSRPNSIETVVTSDSTYSLDGCHINRLEHKSIKAEGYHSTDSNLTVPVDQVMLQSGLKNNLHTLETTNADEFINMETSTHFLSYTEHEKMENHLRDFDDNMTSLELYNSKTFSDLDPEGEHSREIQAIYGHTLEDGLESSRPNDEALQLKDNFLFSFCTSNNMNECELGNLIESQIKSPVALNSSHISPSPELPITVPEPLRTQNFQKTQTESQCLQYVKPQVIQKQINSDNLKNIVSNANQASDSYDKNTIQTPGKLYFTRVNNIDPKTVKTVHSIQPSNDKSTTQGCIENLTNYQQPLLSTPSFDSKFSITPSSSKRFTNISLNSSGSEESCSPPDLYACVPPTPFNTPVNSLTPNSSRLFMPTGLPYSNIGQINETFSNEVLREQHNAKERYRRSRIKTSCGRLRSVVPGMTEKTDKASLLECAAQYITYLRSKIGTQYDEYFIKKIYGYTR